MIDDTIVSGIAVSFNKGTDVQSFQLLMQSAIGELEKYCRSKYNIDPAYKRIAISFEPGVEELTRMILRYKHHPSDEITGHERGI